MPHQVGVFGNFTAVDTNIPFVFVDVRLNGNAAIAVFRLRNDSRGFRADTDQLFVVADTQGRARAKVKDSLGTIGFALTVFTKQNVQPIRK